MSVQALAAFLISWVFPTDTPRKSLDDDLPLWEKHPAEQRALREQDRRAAALWPHIPLRPW